MLSLWLDLHRIRQRAEWLPGRTANRRVVVSTVTAWWTLRRIEPHDDQFTVFGIAVIVGVAGLAVTLVAFPVSLHASVPVGCVPLVYACATTVLKSLKAADR